MSVPDTTVSVPPAGLPEARAAVAPGGPAIADGSVSEISPSTASPVEPSRRPVGSDGERMWTTIYALRL